MIQHLLVTNPQEPILGNLECHMVAPQWVDHSAYSQTHSLATPVHWHIELFVSGFHHHTFWSTKNTRSFLKARAPFTKLFYFTCICACVWVHKHACSDPFATRKFSVTCMHNCALWFRKNSFFSLPFIAQQNVIKGHLVHHGWHTKIWSCPSAHHKGILGSRG